VESELVLFPLCINARGGIPSLANWEWTVCQHPLNLANVQLPRDVPAVYHYAGRVVKIERRTKACMEAAQQHMMAREDQGRREVSGALTCQKWVSIENN